MSIRSKCTSTKLILPSFLFLGTKFSST
jgi:hypothetical protein